MGVEGVEELGDLPRALEAAGYANTGELDGPGTFAVRGGTVDVFPGNLSFPVRLDFFGDELDEIRRIVPATGQTISSLPSVEIYPVSEFPTSPRALARRAARPGKAGAHQPGSARCAGEAGRGASLRRRRCGAAVSVQEAGDAGRLRRSGHVCGPHRAAFALR